jgi:hypothetical protein
VIAAPFVYLTDVLQALRWEDSLLWSVKRPEQLFQPLIFGAHAPMMCKIKMPQKKISEAFLLWPRWDYFYFILLYRFAPKLPIYKAFSVFIVHFNVEKST